MTTDTPSSITDYIASFPKDTREILEQIRATIQKAAPGATEAIKYAIPTFMLNGKNLVHFAAFKSHIGFYATPTGHEAFKEELSVYKQGKGSVQFPIDQPMPLELITRIVQFRVSENMAR
ncbi:MAG: iron chaperone [Saprospiraceae bacterium]